MKLKTITKIPIMTVALLLASVVAFAQSTGDVRSAAEGNWSDAATWEVFNGTDWVVALDAPDGTENVELTHVVTVDLSLAVTGKVTVGPEGQFAVGAEADVTFGDGSTYDHARDGGSIPSVEWAAGSTTIFSGIVGSAPGSRNQSYYNLIIDTPNNSGNKDFGFADITIGGDLVVNSTGSSRWQLTSGGSGTVRTFAIMGDVIMNDGQFAVQGTGNGDTHFTVNHYGDVVVNGGNFSLARGSQGGTGTTTWNLLSGSMTLNAGTSQNSNNDGATFVFAGSDVQSFDIATDYTVSGTGLNMEVEDGAIVSFGENELASTGRFILSSGAEFQTAHADGIAGSLQMSGNVDLSIGASYTFNGTAAQVTSALMPTVVENLTIDNATTVTLSQSTTVNGALGLNAGVFDNSIPFVLGPDGVIVENGGALLVDLIDVSDLVVRSAAEGDWSVAANWEVLSGTDWVAATSAPVGGEQITLHHNITADIALSVSGSVTAEDGGQLSIVQGVVVTFVDGSTYDHARDGGSIPVSTWGEGSTTLFSGIVGSAPGNRNQSYYNLVIDTPNNSGNKDFGFDGITIGGDLIVNSTGSSRWQLTSGGFGTTREFTIAGDVIMNGGEFAVQGTGNGDTHFTVNHHGDLYVNAGNFSLARGSQGGTGTTTWNLTGGSLNLIAGTSQSSNNTGAQFVFSGGGDVQNFNVSDDYTVNGAGIKASVSAGAVVSLGSSNIRGSGGFDVNNGAEIQSGSADGLAGNITTSGTVTLSEAASYTFNGSVAQETSFVMPTTVAGLTIDNAEGVTLTRETTINGQLVLQSGVFDNTIPFALGPIGQVVEAGGSLLIELSDGLEFEAGDYRAVASGSWSDGATWEVYSGTAWSAATDAPTGAEFIYISGSNVVSADVAVAVSGKVLVVEDGQFTVGDGSISWAAGSEYEHGRDGGSIPVSTWEAESTFHLTGTVGGAPGNRNQSYHHVTVNTPDNSGNRDFGFSDVTIGGDINVFMTGTGSNRWQLTSGSSGTTRNFSIMGDVIVHAGQFAVHGTGNGDTHFNVEHYGNLVVNGGNFSIARGSQGGTGTVTWTLHEGDIELNAGTSQNSNNAGAMFVIAGGDVQSISIDAEYTLNGAALNLEIEDGAVLSLGTSELTSTGKFILKAGAELQSAHSSGVAGNVQTTGEVSLSEETNYTFNGTANQETSELMPVVVSNLTIDNETRVTLSQETTINGVLTLAAGIFDNTIPFIIGAEGSIVIDGGRLFVEDVDYEVGDIRSVASGSWSDGTTWEQYNGSGFTPLTGAPEGEFSVFIINSHEVTVDADITLNGRVNVLNDAALTIGEEVVLTFGSGSVYNHARNAGTLPTAVWAEGSTYLITGTTTDAPGNRNQAFYNIDINTTDLTSNVDLGLNGVTIGGNIIIRSTGSGTSRWHLVSGSFGEKVEVTILGNVENRNGNFSVNGTGNGETEFIVHHYGDVIATLGNFSISRGSQGGTGTTRWYFYGDTFRMIASTAQNSNNLGAFWVFAGNDDVQTMDIRSTVTVQGRGLNMDILDGAVVKMGASQIRAEANFSLKAGAAIYTTSMIGFEGNFTPTVNVSLSQQASYGFNGNQFQETSFTMPQIVSGLIIDNPQGVMLTRETTVNDLLVLRRGLFDNTITLSLGPDAQIIEEEGSVLLEIKDVSIDKGEELPISFALGQNYPNPFNPTTQIKYDIPQDVHVSITIYDVTGRQITQLVNGVHTPGVYNVSWNAQQYASGMYLYRIIAGDFTATKRLMLIK